MISYQPDDAGIALHPLRTMKIRLTKNVRDKINHFLTTHM